MSEHQNAMRGVVSAPSAAQAFEPPVSQAAAPYEVGYRKPPATGQFKPGTSGNPKGRPKGSRNVASALMRELNQRVTITENGRRYSISKLEAAIKQLANKAASGEARAMQFLLTLVHSVESQADAAAQPPLSRQADEAVKAALLKSLTQNPGGQ